MKLNNQEVLNIVVTHLRKQGVRAVTDNGYTCMYRNDKGHKCAAGALIPDDDYNPNMEFKTCADVPYFESRVEDVTFLSNLQAIHDDRKVADWESEWAAIATKFNLTMPAREAPEQSQNCG